MRFIWEAVTLNIGQHINMYFRSKKKKKKTYELRL